MTSYQKLKRKIEELEDDKLRLKKTLHNVIINPNDYDAISFVAMYKIENSTVERIDNQMCYGDGTDDSPKGIITPIK